MQKTECKECQRRIRVMQETAEKVDSIRSDILIIKGELLQQTVKMREVIDRL